jgi:hypothetical protein
MKGLSNNRDAGVGTKLTLLDASEILPEDWKREEGHDWCARKGE